MRYISTRGQAQPLDFEQVTLAGLATDGGLYLPESWPHFSPDEIRGMRCLNYNQLAVRILSAFVGESIAEHDLENLIDAAYRDFDHAAIAPIKQLDSRMFFSELFHGPTFSFKDYALQVLGRYFAHFLQKRGQRLTIVGATSGDTGSAAIEAVRGLSAVELFMLHPAGRVSEVQRRQMTTVTDANIHNIAIEGTFDDCQNIVKMLFNDARFKEEYSLAAVNSINWARISAQVVYYFYNALAVGAPDREVVFSVPTGNFGNVFAGYVARRMGLPIKRFVIGSNRNDILTRFFATGVMQAGEVKPTLSPSMDIQISSNFERYLFELYERDGKQISTLMHQFKDAGSFKVDEQLLQQAKELFAAFRVDDDETSEEIARVFANSGEIVDPHSVIAIRAARLYLESEEVENDAVAIVLGTAHSAKFAPAVGKAVGRQIALPDKLQRMASMKEQYSTLADDDASVKNFIQNSLA